MIFTTVATVEDIVNNKVDCPLDITIVPNMMGINLCSVDSFTWKRQPDGQLVEFSIQFLPNNN